MNSDSFDDPSASPKSSKEETPAKPISRTSAARLIDLIQANVAASITAEELHQSGGQQKTMLMDETEAPQ